MSAKQLMRGLNSIAPPALIMFHGLSIVPRVKPESGDTGSHLNLLMSVCLLKSFFSGAFEMSTKKLHPALNGTHALLHSTLLYLYLMHSMLTRKADAAVVVVVVTFSKLRTHHIV